MNSRIFATALFAATLCWTAQIFAQVQTSQPIQVKVKSPIPKPKQIWLKAEVVHADAQSLTVRDRSNPLFVRTFSFSPKVKGQMEKILARGGYQYGDKVEIRYEDGQSVALALKGKPSKPL